MDEQGADALSYTSPAAFMQRLQALHEVSNILLRQPTVDDLCRQAVELGCHSLDFERLSIWFAEGLELARGSYGIDESGQLRDERHVSVHISPESAMGRVMRRETDMVVETQEALRNHLGTVIGQGIHVVAALWDGEHVLGYVCTDNYFSKAPLPEMQYELLRLYATVIGHLYLQKSAYEELRRNEQSYRYASDRAQQYLNVAGVILVALDKLGHITMLNPRGYQVLGYPAGELIGANWFKVCLPLEEVATVFAGHQQLINGDIDTVEYFENNILCKDGSKRYISWHNSVLRDEQGQINGTLSSGEDVTERKQAEETIQQYQDALRSLAAELNQAQERERRRLAVDLHDQISQPLVLANMKLHEVIAHPEAAPLLAPLREISHYLIRSIELTSSLTFELSPPILYELSFGSAIEWLAEQIQEQQKLEIVVHDTREYPALDTEISIVLFRVIHELLMNVVKHAQASRVTVSIEGTNDCLVISVADNGRGMEPVVKTMARQGGFGLFSIHERLRYLGGQLDIETAPDEGTVVTIVVPVKAK